MAIAEPDDGLPRLIDGLRQGSADAGREFWARYGGALQRLATNRLASWLRPRLDPEDIVQSACRTFLRHLQMGSYEVQDDGHLFSLLCAITLNKLSKKARFEQAQRRDARRDVRAAAEPHDDMRPEDAAEFAEVFESLVNSLTEQERNILTLWLEGKSTIEISESAGCTDRWVRRVLERLRDRIA